MEYDPIRLKYIKAFSKDTECGINELTREKIL